MYVIDRHAVLYIIHIFVDIKVRQSEKLTDDSNAATCGPTRAVQLSVPRLIDCVFIADDLFVFSFVDEPCPNVKGVMCTLGVEL